MCVHLWFGLIHCGLDQLAATVSHSFQQLQSKHCMLNSVIGDCSRTVSSQIWMHFFSYLSVHPLPMYLSVFCLPVSWSVYLSVCPLSSLPNSLFLGFLSCRTLLVSLYPSFLCTLFSFSLCPVWSGHFKLNIDRLIYLPAVPGWFKYWHHLGVSTRTGPGALWSRRGGEKRHWKRKRG